VRGLSAGYDHEVTLHDVSFSIRQGERIGLLGPNGAGKSTLFKAIMGLLPTSRGEILIHHTPSSVASMRVAYVPQFDEIDWRFPVSVYDVVMMGRTRHLGWFRFPRKGDRHDSAVRQALARVQLAHLANRQIGDLSGGQKRRVFIARALAQEADVLLLDEPFAGVDATAQETIFNVIDSLCVTGVTVLLATHDLGMAATRFDRLILLNRRLIAFGAPTDVFRPELLSSAFSGQLAIWRESDQGQVVAVNDHCCP
jgi:anchored repeat-type ABC transporter ATP-binding subunit